MLAFLPSGLLILSGVSVIWLSQYRKGVGLPWIIAAAASALSWLGMLLLHWFPPLPLYLIGWNPVEPYTNVLGFQLDLIGWPYAFTLLTITATLMLTAPVRFDSETKPLFWGLNLILAGTGVVAMIAISPLALILCWGLIDIFEMIVLPGLTSNSAETKASVFSFSARLLSVLCIALAMMISRADGVVLQFTNISLYAGLFLMLGIFIRLAIAPWQLTFLSSTRMVREGILLQSISLASALVLLARLPDDLLPAGWVLWARLVLGLIALIAALMWLIFKSDLLAKPYWMISLVCISLLSALNGYQITSMVWGLALLLMSGLITLYTHRDAGVQYIAALAVLNFIGLPFTPLAGGWIGLMDQPISLFQPLIVLVHLLLTLGLIRHLFFSGESIFNMERWIQVIYPVGLLLLILSHWMIATVGWPGSYTAGVWWASILPLLLFGGGYFLRLRTNWIDMPERKAIQLAGVIESRLLVPVSNFFRFAWILRIFAWFFSLFEYFINLVTRLLEGEGAFLWVLLLLAILMTFVFPGGAA